jgi:Ca-activated chloride channel family protein
VLRILGQRLMQAARADLAVPVFRKILALAPNEPQSYRDLGLALAADHQPQAAIDALYDVVRKPWPRFPEIELIALTELNAIVASHAATGASVLDTSRIDSRLLKNLPLDLRATLSWDADNTDIDLWVTDPNGERAYYGHPLTWQGGRMSRDITGGYGPGGVFAAACKAGQVHRAGPVLRTPAADRLGRHHDPARADNRFRHGASERTERDPALEGPQ